MLTFFIEENKLYADFALHQIISIDEANLKIAKLSPHLLANAGV